MRSSNCRRWMPSSPRGHVRPQHEAVVAVGHRHDVVGHAVELVVGGLEGERGRALDAAFGSPGANPPPPAGGGTGGTGAMSLAGGTASRRAPGAAESLSNEAGGLLRAARGARLVLTAAPTASGTATATAASTDATPAEGDHRRAPQLRQRRQREARSAPPRGGSPRGRARAARPRRRGRARGPRRPAASAISWSSRSGSAAAVTAPRARASSTTCRSRSTVASSLLMAGLPQLRDGPVKSWCRRWTRRVPVTRAISALERPPANLSATRSRSGPSSSARAARTTSRRSESSAWSSSDRAARSSGSVSRLALRLRRRSSSSAALRAMPKIHWSRVPRAGCSCAACGRRARTPARSRPRPPSGPAAARPRRRRPRERALVERLEGLRWGCRRPARARALRWPRSCSHYGGRPRSITAVLRALRGRGFSHYCAAAACAVVTLAAYASCSPPPWRLAAAGQAAAAPQLWATVNTCDTAAFPDTLGDPGEHARQRHAAAPLHALPAAVLRPGAGRLPRLRAGHRAGSTWAPRAFAPRRRATRSSSTRPPVGTQYTLRGLVTFEYRARRGEARWWR